MDTGSSSGISVDVANSELRSCNGDILSKNNSVHIQSSPGSEITINLGQSSSSLTTDPSTSSSDSNTTDSPTTSSPSYSRSTGWVHMGAAFAVGVGSAVGASYVSGGSARPMSDPRMLLQAYAAEKGWYISYSTTCPKPTQRDGFWRADCTIDGYPVGTGFGVTAAEAQRNAAQQALRALGLVKC